jgi:hypothetical protein
MLEELYGTVTMKKTQVYDWHKRFLDGRSSVNDNPSCGLPPSSTEDENVMWEGTDERAFRGYRRKYGF